MSQARLSFPRTLRNVDPVRLSAAMDENMRILERHINTILAVATDLHAQDHASRHYDAGADEIDVVLLASVGAAGVFLERDGSGGLQWASPAAASDPGYARQIMVGGA